VAQTSVIGLTGQYWKLVAGIAALLAGSIVPLFETSGMSWTAGTIVAVGGYAFTCLTVRCPACGSRWFWEAALDAGLYGPLFKRSHCPACKRDFAPSATNS
jgi:hypothetical protein